MVLIDIVQKQESLFNNKNRVIPIVAYKDGIISNIFVESGTVVDIGDRLFDIVSGDRKVVEGYSRNEKIPNVNKIKSLSLVSGEIKKKFSEFPTPKIGENLITFEIPNDSNSVNNKTDENSNSIAFVNNKTVTIQIDYESNTEYFCIPKKSVFSKNLKNYIYIKESDEVFEIEEVTVVTSREGMNPEEIEKFVTIPIQQAINGSQNLRRVKGKSSVGLSIVTAEFDWSSDYFKVRQSVFERVQLVKKELDSIDVEPEIAPMSSITGEISVIGVYGEGVHPRELRDIAEWIIRPRILSISGVAQVTPIGGEEKELQIILKPEKLELYKITPKEISESLERANRNYEGGFINWGYQEFIVTAKGRFLNIESLLKLILSFDKNGSPIYLNDVAHVEFGSKISRGAAGINGKEATLLTIQKQIDGDTINILKNIDKTLQELKNSMPEGVTLFVDGFRQDSFINLAVNNIKKHLIESSILIIFIIFLFLWNIRTTIISLVTIPISLFISIYVLKLLEMTINTMTLCGFAIAIGSIVDDAIIDVENIYRRLKISDTNQKNYINIVL